MYRYKGSDQSLYGNYTEINRWTLFDFRKCTFTEEYVRKRKDKHI